MLDQVPTREGQRLTRDQLAALLSRLDGSEATAGRAWRRSWPKPGGSMT